MRTVVERRGDFEAERGAWLLLAQLLEEVEHVSFSEEDYNAHVSSQEEDLETIRGDTGHPWSGEMLARTLHRISRPTVREHVPLLSDPDDYPLS